MDNSVQDWVKLIRDDYLREFVRGGGASVKFAVADGDSSRKRIVEDLRRAAIDEGFRFASVDAEQTRIHLIDQLFSAVAQQIDWDELAYSCVSRLLKENGCQQPADRIELSLARVAELNNREEMFLRQDINSWLENHIYRDFRMCQEYRLALIKLCLTQLDPSDAASALPANIKAWLQGKLPRISVLKPALIFQKVARHNARHMLYSLTHWLNKNGNGGLVLALDVSRYMLASKPKEPDGSLYYSTPATMDLYELLRQFIDGTDDLENCLIAVVAGPEFLDEGPRGMARYNALRMRITDEVHDETRQNPYASLIRLSAPEATA